MARKSWRFHFVMAIVLFVHMTYCSTPIGPSFKKPNLRYIVTKQIIKRTEIGSKKASEAAGPNTPGEGVKSETPRKAANAEMPQYPTNPFQTSLRPEAPRTAEKYKTPYAAARSQTRSEAAGFWTFRHKRQAGMPPAVIGSGADPPTLPKLAVKDNHKPIFKDCLNYRPVVKEEQPLNTYVFTIKAEDVDPPDMGGTVTYKFVTSPGEKERFHVDPETGRISTKDIFDHDEPSREKEAYITVRASDNGQPTLDDACTIRIIIEDINDNQPVFDKVSYSESVPQDLPASRVVMRISATDIDEGNNSVVTYSLDNNSADQTYFYMAPDNGLIYLNKTIDKQPGYKFKLSAIVKDHGVPPTQSSIPLDITVVDSNKKGPTFTELPKGPIRIKENFSEFNLPIAVIKAESNIPEEAQVQFELVQGQTEQTNKRNTFILEPDGNVAVIKLGNHLDFEKISEYVLTIRVSNNYKLAAEMQIFIEVEDVNDNVPIFSGIQGGTVPENEPPGTFVMKVQAIDADGTKEHKTITYALADPDVPFAIDPNTGNITTLRTFDREEQPMYYVKVVATDSSDSALTPGKHNSGQQILRIEIADKNDNPPKFTSDTFVAEAIPENANVNELVTQVTAEDIDTASQTTYTIVSGNEDGHFSIGLYTGEIRVKKPLDYEQVQTYVLHIRAFDGIYEDYAKVVIKIENINDNPPVFVEVYSKTIEEERLYDGCLLRVKAFDPDILDRSLPQNIHYSLVKVEQQEFLSIDNEGCLRLIKPLDRDPPTGFIKRQILISAADHNGKVPDSLKTITEIVVELTDINDNAPFLTISQPVVWYENREPGTIVTLTAKDYDSPENGPPFTFALNDTSFELYSKFSIVGNTLVALVKFDREVQKEYWIPVSITDSGNPPMTGVSMLHVVIGDINDNAMAPGSSTIFAYNYRGRAPDMEIGRVYVNDPDDWDLPSKQFMWLGDEPSSDHFHVLYDGMIVMKEGTPAGQYFLNFNVTEESTLIPRHHVTATVNVTVKAIPEEAVDNSGSIRFLNCTAESFIIPEDDGSSKKDKLHRRLATVFNASFDNVDVFTVMPKVTVKDRFLDVRFSAHGSPYYSPEKLNTLAIASQKDIERDTQLRVYMIRIDECLFEKEQCEDACRNVLVKSLTPAAVYTNTTSFVGVSAQVEAECTCEVIEANICYNGGTPVGDKCECNPGYLGPRCEETAIGFNGNGFAMYPALEVCADDHIALTFTTKASDGLIFYWGPSHYNELVPVQDFMALAIRDGYPELLVNYGSGTTRLNNTAISVTNNEPHLIEILTTKNTIEMFVDRCKLTSCMSLSAPVGKDELLNGEEYKVHALDEDRKLTCSYCYTLPQTFNVTEVPAIEDNIVPIEIKIKEIRKHCSYDEIGKKMVAELRLLEDGTIFPMATKAKVAGPLLLGGAPMDLNHLAVMYNWKYTPHSKPFEGCISNFTFNNKVFNLGSPAYSQNVFPGCSREVSKSATYAFGTMFLIPVLVCFCVLLVLLLAVVVHRRRSDTWAEKELDDIRENIIAYEDEGGGEGDAGYDLHVLRQMYEGRPPDADRGYMHTGLVAAAPDISGFLDDKKSVLDRDADVNPLDDVRHYAYEGDGNSTGSLSSLASSGIDDGDQNFTYLTSFGPRFRKLADMYNDSDTDRPHEESWC